MDGQELIEKHLANQLSKEEKDQFNLLLKEDAQFREEFDFYEDLKRVAQKYDEEEFKEKLKSFDQERPVLAKKMKWSWAVAASTALVLGFFLYNNIRSTDKDSLFQEYFEPAQNVSLPLVRGVEVEQELTKALIAYEQRDYLSALAHFENIPLNSTPSWLPYYEGNAFLSLGRTTEAIEMFKIHSASDDSLAPRSHWFLALAYIKEKNLKLAFEELTILESDKTHFKEKETVQLLSKLSDSLPSP